MFVTGLVLAAGSSTRLGEPKQLLPFRGTTLLDTTLAMARECRFDQLIVALGGASPEVHDTVDLTGVDVAENVHFTSGCSSSIVAALDLVDPRAHGLVLLLGDQPQVQPDNVHGLVEIATGAPDISPLAVCRYNDGRGHPFWFARAIFDDLRELHGDKAVWKLLESGEYPVAELPVAGAVPLDVDTWDDYEMLLATEGNGRAELNSGAEPGG